jgi:hypothetical protein
MGPLFFSENYKLLFEYYVKHGVCVCVRARARVTFTGTKFRQDLVNNFSEMEYSDGQIDLAIIFSLNALLWKERGRRSAIRFCYFLECGRCVSWFKMSAEFQRCFLSSK